MMTREAWSLVWCVLTFGSIFAAIQQFNDGHILLGLACLGVVYALSPKTGAADLDRTDPVKRGSK